MKKQRSKALRGAALAVLLVLGAGWWLLWADFGTSKGDGVMCLRSGAGIEDVYDQLDSVARPGHMVMFRLLAGVSGYAKHVKPGRYQVEGVGTLRLLRNLRNGHQLTLRFPIPVVNLPVDLARKLGTVFEAGTDDFAKAFADPATCAAAGTTPEQLFCIIVPDSYDFYWNMTPRDFLQKMKRESERYWTDKRCALAQERGLTPQQAVTLASIVERETADGAEKPRIAGLYLNRLHQGMRLQADPTVKFAVGDFGLRRILHNHLATDSPYNTYRHDGLPPGPICLPGRESLEAVLHSEAHNYLYMCAKEDFSGSHNFAATYEEHLRNAARYAEALNRRGIK